MVRTVPVLFFLLHVGICVTRVSLPIACSNASFSVGEHPALPGYFLRNHLTKQEVEFSTNNPTNVKCIVRHQSMSDKSNVCSDNGVNLDTVTANGIKEITWLVFGKRVWLTDRTGKAAAAWRWPAPDHGFLRRAWCPPTCRPALCLSPSANHSFWTAAVLRRPHPAHFYWTAPWQRRTLQRGKKHVSANLLSKHMHTRTYTNMYGHANSTVLSVSIFVFMKVTALKRRTCSARASAPLFSH